MRSPSLLFTEFISIFPEKIRKPPRAMRNRSREIYFINLNPAFAEEVPENGIYEYKFRNGIKIKSHERMSPKENIPFKGYFKNYSPKKVVTIFLAAIIPTAILLYLRSIATPSVYLMIALSVLFFAPYILLMFPTYAFDRNNLEVIRAGMSKFTGMNKETRIMDLGRCY